MKIQKLIIVSIILMLLWFLVLVVMWRQLK